MPDKHNRPSPVWRAWFAFEGDDRLDAVREYIQLVGDTLGAHAAGGFEFTPGGRDAFDADLRLFMIGLGGAIADDGKSEIKLSFSRRRPGKPVLKHARARRGRRAAALVEKLVADGIKQESALSDVSDTTGLSRSEIMTWIRDGRWWISSSE